LQRLRLSREEGKIFSNARIEKEGKKTAAPALKSPPIPAESTPGTCIGTVAGARVIAGRGEGKGVLMGFEEGKKDSRASQS